LRHPHSEEVRQKLIAADAATLTSAKTLQEHRAQFSEALAMFVDEHQGIIASLTTSLKHLENQNTQRLLHLDAVLEIRTSNEQATTTLLPATDIPPLRAHRKAAIVRVQHHLTHIEALQADLAYLHNLCHPPVVDSAPSTALIPLAKPSSQLQQPPLPLPLPSRRFK